MNPGLFSDRVTFRYFVKNADGYGGYTATSGGTMETLWAYVIPESGKIVDDNGKRGKQKVKKVIVRKNDFDLLDTVDVNNNDIGFSVEGDSNDYRVNDAFESTPDEYVTITGTSQ